MIDSNQFLGIANVDKDWKEIVTMLQRRFFPEKLKISKSK